MCEFHTMQPDHTHFLVLPALPTNFVTSLTTYTHIKKKKKKKEKELSPICVAPILTGAWSNSLWLSP